MEFEWDPAKAEHNLRKHNVSFTEATTVFGDFLSVTVADPDHSENEERFITVGESVQGRLLFVAHTQGNESESIRIISARPLTNHEKRTFEGGEWEQ